MGRNMQLHPICLFLSLFYASNSNWELSKMASNQIAISYTTNIRYFIGFMASISAPNFVRASLESHPPLLPTPHSSVSPSIYPSAYFNSQIFCVSHLLNLWSNSLSFVLSFSLLEILGGNWYFRKNTCYFSFQEGKKRTRKKKNSIYLTSYQ